LYSTQRPATQASPDWQAPLGQEFRTPPPTTPARLQLLQLGLPQQAMVVLQAVMPAR
jgi:hypothetical protein